MNDFIIDWTLILSFAVAILWTVGNPLFICWQHNPRASKRAEAIVELFLLYRVERCRHR
jgi:hypothetical protein